MNAVSQRGLRRERHSQEVKIFLKRWRERGVVGARTDARDERPVVTLRSCPCLNL